MQSNRVAQRNDAASRRIAVRAAIAASIAVLMLPIALFAHAHLRRSEPSAHQRLTTPPLALRLWFTESPELAFTRVRLRASDSSDIALGAVTRMSDDPLGISLSIPATLIAGAYTVLWRTAAADGHASSGSFTFEVVHNSTMAGMVGHDTLHPAGGHTLVRVDSTADSLPSLNVSAATRWLEFMALLAVVGAVAFRLVVLPRAERVLAGALPAETRLELGDSARRLAQSALVLSLIGAMSRLYAEASAVLGPDHPVDATAMRTLLGTSWGMGWLVGIVGIVVAAAGFIIVRRARSDAGWMIAAFGAAAMGVAPALTGHARATSPVALAVVTDVLHVLGTSAWLGALLSLLFAALPLVRGRGSRSGVGSGPLVASLVQAFHPVALTCAAVVIASGVLAAWLRLPSISSLWESTYGRVLLLKLAFVAIVVVLGAVNWRRMLPSLGDERAAQRITRTAGAELTIAALVLAITAVLVSTSPPDAALGILR